jgi:hypothetical protein
VPRHNFQEKSKLEADREIYRQQDTFDAAMVSGPPASKLPPNAVAWLYNLVAYKHWLQGRFGCRIYSDDCTVSYPSTQHWASALPGMTDRHGYTGTKSDYTVTSPDASFTVDDVSNYWVWDDGYHDEITAFVSATQVTVRDSGTRSGNACFLRGKHNGWWYHKGLKKVVLLVGTEVFVSDTMALASWSRAICISTIEPNNVISQFDDFDENSAIFFNSAGMYKVILDTDRPYCYKMNTPGPSQYITGIEPTDTLPYGRRIIYTASRIRGTGIRDRREATEGAVIEQESCPNLTDDDGKDYGEVWTALPRGDSTKTQGRVVGAQAALASRDANTVWAAVTDGGATFTINARQHTFFVDFSGVETMAEVATRIQTGMRIYWPDATCTYTNDRFYLTSGYVDGSTFDAIAAPGAGTDITAAGFMNIINSTPNNLYVYAEPYITDGISAPVVAGTTTSQWHWTHYSLYGTQDIGVNGLDPITGEGNNPERYIWMADLRIAAAFYATRNESGLVTALVGEFEEADVGSVLEWWDGDRDTILQYVSSTQVIIEGAAYPEGVKTGACAIGDGTVIEASQSGRTITRTRGGYFTANDVRKTLYWADGGYSIITDFVSHHNVRVHESRNRELQGVTFDPVARSFNDTIDDEILLARTKDYTVRNRAWEPLPLTNTGKITPGWIFTAVRDTQPFYYAQHAPGTKYLAGYHNPLQENNDCKDVIKRIEEFPNRIIFYCAQSVYGGPTNTSIPIEVPGTGEFINTFSGLQILDANIGVPDYGSVIDVVGAQVCITSEPAVRVFDGFKFGPNLGEDAEGNELIMNELRQWAHETAAGFKDGELFLWGLV